MFYLNFILPKKKSFSKSLLIIALEKMNARGYFRKINSKMICNNSLQKSKFSLKSVFIYVYG